MKKIILSLRRRLKITQFRNAWTGKWRNARIKFFPQFEFPDGKKDNMIEFYCLHSEDVMALCTSKKLRTIKGRSFTVSSIRLSDEAIVALHRITGLIINERLETEGKSMTDEELQAIIDNWPKGKDNRWISDELNAFELPFEQYMMGVDYYKKIGKFDPNKTTENDQGTSTP